MSKRSIKRRAFTPLFESLETRAMLAADLTGAFTVPDAAVSVNSGQAQPVTLHVTNTGDASAAKFKIDFFLYTGTFDAATATPLSTYTRNPAVKPDVSFDVNTNLTIPASTAPGSYKIAALIDSGQTVFETSDSNNTASTGTVTVTQPAYDLTASFASVKLSPSIIEHTATSGTAKINIAVAGAATLPGKLIVGLNVVLRPIGGGNDIVIGSNPRQSIAGLTAAKPKSANIKLAVPIDLLAGSYKLVVIVDPATQALPLGALAESNEANNAAINPDFTFTSAAEFNDVGLTSATHTFTSPATAGDKATGTFVIQNFGNKDVTGNATVTFFARKAGEADRSLGSVAVPLKLKAGAANKAINVSLTLPGTLTNNATYDIVAVFTPPSGLGDVTGNNALTAGTAVTVTVPVQPAVVRPDIGDKLIFHETDKDTFSVPGVGVIRATANGTFTDGNGRTGTFHLEWGSTAADPDAPGPTRTYIELHYANDGGSLLNNITFYPPTAGGIKSVGNKTLTCTSNPAGAEAVTNEPDIYINLA